MKKSSDVTQSVIGHYSGVEAMVPFTTFGPLIRAGIVVFPFQVCPAVMAVSSRFRENVDAEFSLERHPREGLRELWSI